MSAPYGGRPIEILLVEDNPGDVRLTQEALRESKVRNNLHVAATGEEALRYLRGEAEGKEPTSPDLILLDLKLPGMSGHELLERMKEEPELRSIPVVVLTSSEAEDDIARSYDLHANAFVSKPVGMEGLMEIVRAIDHFWFTVVRLPERGDRSTPASA